MLPKAKLSLAVILILSILFIFVPVHAAQSKNCANTDFACKMQKAISDLNDKLSQMGHVNNGFGRNISSCANCSDGTLCNATNSRDQTCTCMDINRDNTNEFCYMVSHCANCSDGTLCNATNSKNQTCTCMDANKDRKNEVCILLSKPNGQKPNGWNMTPCTSCQDGTLCNATNSKNQSCACMDVNRDNQTEFCNLIPHCNSCSDGTACGQNNSRDMTCACMDINRDSRNEFCMLYKLRPQWNKTPGGSKCVANTTLGCKVCKTDGSGWVDDSSKCLANQSCRSGQCLNNNPNSPSMSFSCPQTCFTEAKCNCTVYNCSSGILAIANLVGQPINMTQMTMEGDFPLTFFSSSPYIRNFGVYGNGTVQATAICLDSGRIGVQKTTIDVIDNQTFCTPNSTQGCSVCLPDGSEWIDTNELCSANQTCQNGSCINQICNPNQANSSVSFNESDNLTLAEGANTTYRENNVILVNSVGATSVSITIGTETKIISLEESYNFNVRLNVKVVSIIYMDNQTERMVTFEVTRRNSCHICNSEGMAWEKHDEICPVGEGCNDYGECTFF
jgi:hypothetical protein